MLFSSRDSIVEICTVPLAAAVTRRVGGGASDMSWADVGTVAGDLASAVDSGKVLQANSLGADTDVNVGEIAGAYASRNGTALRRPVAAAADATVGSGDMRAKDGA